MCRHMKGDQKKKEIVDWVIAPTQNVMFEMSSKFNMRPTIFFCYCPDDNFQRLVCDWRRWKWMFCAEALAWSHVTNKLYFFSSKNDLIDAIFCSQTFSVLLLNIWRVLKWFHCILYVSIQSFIWSRIASSNFRHHWQCNSFLIENIFVMKPIWFIESTQKNNEMNENECPSFKYSILCEICVGIFQLALFFLSFRSTLFTLKYSGIISRPVETDKANEWPSLNRFDSINYFAFFIATF